jgi:FkbM family methyltransferase
MNYSGISSQSFLGKACRFPLRFLPSGMKMKILQGRLKGKKWIVGSSTHGCWLGSYEYDKQKKFEKMVKPGSVVYDLGGHVGFYSLLASEIVGPTGKVFVFEPFPKNLNYLHRHLQINNVCNVVVMEAAVSGKSGIMNFSEGPSSSMGHLNSEGSMKVKVVTIDELYSKGELPLPDFVKIDIEGAEYLALTGAKDVLEKSHPVIFLATHGKTVHKQCCEFLSSQGYELKSLDEREIGQTDEVIAIYNVSQ